MSPKIIWRFSKNEFLKGADKTFQRSHQQHRITQEESNLIMSLQIKLTGTIKTDTQVAGCWRPPPRFLPVTHSSSSSSACLLDIYRDLQTNDRQICCTGSSGFFSKGRTQDEMEIFRFSQVSIWGWSHSGRNGRLTFKTPPRFRTTKIIIELEPREESDWNYFR